MKIRNSLKSLKDRHRDNRVIRQVQKSTAATLCCHALPTLLHDRMADSSPPGRGRFAHGQPVTGLASTKVSRSKACDLSVLR